MRKVYLKTRAKVMVPVIVTYESILHVDEGVEISKIATRIVSGKIPDSVDVENSEVVAVEVEGSNAEDSENQQIVDFLCENEKAKPKYIGHEIIDSK